MYRKPFNANTWSKNKYITIYTNLSSENRDVEDLYALVGEEVVWKPYKGFTKVGVVMQARYNVCGQSNWHRYSIDFLDGFRPLWINGDELFDPEELEAEELE